MELKRRSFLKLFSTIPAVAAVSALGNIIESVGETPHTSSESTDNLSDDDFLFGTHYWIPEMDFKRVSKKITVKSKRYPTSSIKSSVL